MPLTIAQLLEAESMRQVKFSIGAAKVRDVESFQDDDGKPVFYAKVEMGASVVTILGDQAEIEKLSPFKGKLCSISGFLETELRKNGLKVRFSISTCTELK